MLRKKAGAAHWLFPEDDHGCDLERGSPQKLPE